MSLIFDAPLFVSTSYFQERKPILLCTTHHKHELQTLSLIHHKVATRFYSTNKYTSPGIQNDINIFLRAARSSPSKCCAASFSRLWASEFVYMYIVFYKTSFDNVPCKYWFYLYGLADGRKHLLFWCGTNKRCWIYSAYVCIIGGIEFVVYGKGALLC